MPFINNKITVPVDEGKREALKAGYGKAISVFGKTEDWVMVSIEDGSELYFGGKKLELGAYVEVNLMGEIDDAAALAYTKHTCKMLGDELGIPADCIYVTFNTIPAARWGWNGHMF